MGRIPVYACNAKRPTIPGETTPAYIQSTWKLSIEWQKATFGRRVGKPRPTPSLLPNPLAWFTVVILLVTMCMGNVFWQVEAISTSP
jgi:hypothetical protein